MCALYDGFAILEPNEDGEVGLGAIREKLSRVSGAPIDEAALEQWMAEADSDGDRSLSFFEYVRVESVLYAAEGSAPAAVAVPPSSATRREEAVQSTEPCE